MDAKIDDIAALYKRKGYLMTDFNIFGIRLNDNLDKFTDIRGVLYKLNGTWSLVTWKQTTKPAAHALAHPVNKDGCAIIKEGQYINCWEIGLHKGHEALVQCAPVKVYRDNKKDGTFNIADCVEMTAGPECGLNHHTVWWGGHPEWDGTYPSVSYGGDWSEGCQCGERPSEHHAFMNLCKGSGLKMFSYALFNTNDFLNFQQ